MNAMASFSTTTPVSVSNKKNCQFSVLGELVSVEHEASHMRLKITGT